jgi:hypothetical protein
MRFWIKLAAFLITVTVVGYIANHHTTNTLTTTQVAITAPNATPCLTPVTGTGFFNPCADLNTDGFTWTTEENHS